MFWWTAIALAAPPDGEAAALEVASTKITDLVLAADGELLAFRDAAAVHVLDVDSWDLVSGQPCTATGVALAEREGTEVYVSCADGTVRALDFDGESLSPTVDVDGEAVTWDIGSTAHGVWWDPERERLYALGVDEGADQLSLHAIDPATGDLDGPSDFPGALVYRGFIDAIVSGTRLYVFHGGDDVSSFVLGTGVALPNFNPYPGITPKDLAPSLRESVYVVSPAGISEYLPASGMYQLWLTGLSETSALGMSLDVEDEYALVADGSGVDVYDVSGGALVGVEPIDGFDTSEPLVDIVVGQGGYAFGGGERGSLLVLSANPWVSSVQASPGLAAEGTELTVSFEVDTPGAWSLRLNGDRTGTGEVLAVGQVAAAGPVETTFTVDDAWREGTNFLYVLHEDADRNVGHGRASVVVDSPPGAPLLDQGSVGYSDGGLRLTFPALPDEDLERYEVYVTVTPFASSDWPTGGPDFDGDDALEAPISVSASDDDTVSLRIAPLTNGVTYYIAVRAFDAGGLEGAMSEVVAGTPNQTFAASDLAGETGGTLCATGVGVGGWASLLAGLAVLARRRRRVDAALAAVIVGGLAVAAPAQAQDVDDSTFYSFELDYDDPDDRWADYTDVYGNFEFRYGVWNLDDDDNPIADVYEGRWGRGSYDFFMVEFGPQFWGFLEIDLGLGLLRRSGFQLGVDGTPSGDEARLTLFPLSLSGTLRGQFVDEQVLVPYASIGPDYVIWRESFDVGEGTDSRTGGKWGWHTALGVNLLLDVFDRSRASLLEAQTGINDTYLVFEWRNNNIGDGDGGFDFSSDVFSIGLKLDY